MRGLPRAEYEAIRRVLNWLVNESLQAGEPVLTSSWIPGSDWPGTVLQPIYEKACNRNAQAAALFYGLLLSEPTMS